MAEKKLVTGLFKTREKAEAAVRELSRRGYKQEDVSVLMSDATKSKEFGIEAETKAAKGATVGGAAGGTVGAALAAIAAVGTSVALPGLGLVVAGPLAAALAGAGAGGLTGGVIGALVGAGIPEYRAKAYESGIKAGGILMGVEAKSSREGDEIEELFENLGAEKIKNE